MSIQGLLGAPNPDDPLTVEIGKRWSDDVAASVKTAMEWTRLYAMPKLCDRADTGSVGIREHRDACDSPGQEFYIGEASRDNLISPTSQLPSPTAMSKIPANHFTHATPIRSEGVFKYAPLQEIGEIRLLQLQPGSRGDPIVGVIDHATLPGRDCTTHLASPIPGCAVCKNTHNVAPYEALSYAWGNTSTTETIVLYDPHSKLYLSLGVTLNCARALETLRLPDEGRLVWVDAVCINQADVAERSAQVKIMHRIYRAASRVLIYLGDGSAGSDEAICILEDDANGDRPCVTDSLNYNEVSAVRALLRRPWFHRVWVLQEVAWSRSALVLCGSRTTPWRETFCNAYSSSIGHIDDLKPLPYVMSFGELRPSDTFLTPEALLRELRNARDCASTDAKDKIYALLALFQGRPDDNRLAIDYTRRLPDIFTDVASYLLEKIGASILSEAYGCSKITGLPSWVPDWTVPSRERPYRFQRCFSGGRRAGPIEFISSLRETSKRLMKVRAVSVGRVEAIFMAFNGSIDAALATLLQWVSKENYGYIEKLVEDITLVETGSRMGCDLRWLVKLGAEIDPEVFSRIWAKEGKRMKQVLSKFWNRAFFVTDGEVTGLAPHAAQKDDEIRAETRWQSI
jgi:hypothetical protein